MLMALGARVPEPEPAPEPAPESPAAAESAPVVVLVVDPVLDEPAPLDPESVVEPPLDDPPPLDPPPLPPPPLPAAGVTAVDTADAAEVPIVLVAVAVNVYEVPFVRPATMHDVAGAVTVQVFVLSSTVVTR